MKELKCPAQCDCLLVAALCVNAGIINNEQLNTFSFLVIVNSTLANVRMEFVTSCAFFSLIDAKLTLDCQLFHPQQMVHLYITQNIFKVVESNCFKGGTHLKIIKLINNKIEMLEQNAFAQVGNLRYLNLSYNHLVALAKNRFPEAPKLKGLSLIGTSLDSCKSNMLQDLNLEILETNDYHLCCVVPNSTECNAERPWHIWCSRLLPTTSLKATYISLSTLSVCLIVVSIICLLMAKNKKNKAFTISAVAVSIGEIISAVYFFILCIADATLASDFILYEQQWRSSVGCSAAATLHFLFNILDPTLLYFLSLSRLMVVKHPLETKLTSISFVWNSIILIIICTVCVSLLIATLIHIKFHNKLPTSLCVFFVDPVTADVSIKTVTFIVASLHVVISVAISITHCLLLSEVKESANRVSSVAGKAKSTGMTLQLVVVTASNLISWIPADIIFIVSLFLTTYPPQMLLWTVVAIAPNSCIINPAVFASTSARNVYRNRKSSPK